ncbi:MAG TPA: hypothetical protein PLY72_06775 [Candidatus Obscuribacter sp.]|nr:hypothetical protein [Candidatus Obscuribacter sp.]HNG74140.1 hypothetical protein [Candidatus Obscuribacter sp.]
MSDLPSQIKADADGATLLAPYGKSRYSLELSMSGADLLSRLKEDTTSGFGLMLRSKPFYGKVSADGFKLRSTRVSTRNSWSPQVVGRVKAGSRENTCLVEFSFDLPTSIKIASPLVFLSFLVVLIALLPELTSPGKAVFLLFQFLFLATIIPLSLYMGLRLGKKDKQHILEYFQNLPGAKLSVQKRLIE